MNKEKRDILFWKKVKKTDTCWFWTGAKTNGYGQFWVGDKSVKSHRYSYVTAKGPIPNDMQVDHMCMLRSCVNPDHLRLVTISENVKAKNYKYVSRPKPRETKSFLLYITDPRFKDEPKKSRLVQQLLEAYYNGQELKFPYKTGNTYAKEKQTEFMRLRKQFNDDYTIDYTESQ